MVTLLTLSGSLLSLAVFGVYSAKLIAVIMQPTYPVKTFSDLVELGFNFYTTPQSEDVVFNKGNEVSSVFGEYYTKIVKFHTFMVVTMFPASR